MFLPSRYVTTTAWYDIATFKANGWNASSFLLIADSIIYKINLGYDLKQNSYIARCGAKNLITDETNSRIGYKVINNTLHIYHKPAKNRITLTCLGYGTENELAVFSFAKTSFTDADMDKIC